MDVYSSMNPRSIRIQDNRTLEQWLNDAKTQAVHKVVIADELHQRGLPVPMRPANLNYVIGLMTPIQVKEILGRFNEFSMAMIHHIVRVHQRKLRGFQFFVAEEGRPERTIELSDITEHFDSLKSNNAHIWNEYARNWMSINMIVHWKEGQDFEFAAPPQAQTGYAQRTTSKPPSPERNSSAIPFILSVIIALSVPFWFVMVVVALVSGFSHFMGPLLPTVFSIFMFIISIPMAIGIYQRRKWAWGFLTFSAFFGVVWFGGNVLIDGAGKVWLLLALVEGIILTLALTTKDAFA